MPEPHAKIFSLNSLQCDFSVHDHFRPIQRKFCLVPWTLPFFLYDQMNYLFDFVQCAVYLLLSDLHFKTNLWFIHPSPNDMFSFYYIPWNTKVWARLITPQLLLFKVHKSVWPCDCLCETFCSWEFNASKKPHLSRIGECGFMPPAQDFAQSSQLC